MTLERGLLMAGAFGLFAAGFYLAAYVVPRREKVWIQFVIVAGVVSIVGAGGMALLIATMAP